MADFQLMLPIVMVSHWRIAKYVRVLSERTMHILALQIGRDLVSLGGFNACQVGVPRNVCIGSPDWVTQQCDPRDPGGTSKAVSARACKYAEVVLLLGASLRGWKA